MFVSHAHKALVVPYSPDVHRLFPHAKPFQYEGANVVALPHRTQETRLLRNLAIHAPAPIREHYPFTRYKPFEVQIRTADLLTTQPRAYVLNEFGTGKTKSALWAYDYLRKDGEANKMLVVCPLSTINFTWSREAIDTLPGIRVSVLTGTKEKRLKRLGEDADIYIINHDGVGVIMRELIARTDIDVIVLDEAAAYRNYRAQRSKIMREVLKGRAWVWAMTGSPTPQSPTDAYGLAKLVTPHTAPSSFMWFRNETMTQLSQFRWMPRRDAHTIVAKYLQPSVRFALDDVVELPEVIEREIVVPMGPRQRVAYKQLEDDMAMRFTKGDVTAVNGGVLYTKLLQTSCGYVYLDNGKVETLDNQGRIDAVLDIIDAASNKVIVFCSFLSAVAGMTEALRRESVDFRVVTGATPQGQRAETFNLFQRTESVRVLLAHPQCMSHGLTLTAADTIVWFSPTPNLEIFEQANARIRRVGQQHKQQILMLASTPAERVTYRHLRSKRDTQNSVLELLAEITSEQP